MNIVKNFFYLESRRSDQETDTQRTLDCWFTLQIPETNRAGPRPKPGGGNLVRLADVSGRNPVTTAVTAASRGIYSKEAGIGNWSQVLNPDIPIWAKMS